MLTSLELTHGRYLDDYGKYLCLLVLNLLMIAIRAC